MPEKIQIGRRVTQEGELRLLLKREDDPDDKTMDFSVFEWLSLISIMSGKLRDSMAEVTGQARPKEEHPPKSDILIAQNVGNISPIRSRRKR